MREILHGMGFSSELYPFEIVTSLDPPLSIDLAFPIMDSHDLNSNELAKPLQGTHRISVFDSLLHGNLSFAEQGKEFGEFKARPGMSEDDFLASIVRNEKTRKAGIELFRMITKNNIDAHLSDGTKLRMHHFRYAEDYSPIRYLANTLITGPEFLMTPFWRIGYTINSEMKTLGLQNMLGPQTVQLMEDLGYATKKNPNRLLQLKMIEN